MRGADVCGGSDAENRAPPYPMFCSTECADRGTELDGRRTGRKGWADYFGRAGLRRLSD